MRCFLCKKNNFGKKYTLQTKKILRCKNDGLFIVQSTDKEEKYGKEYFSNQPNSFNESYFLSKLKKIQRLTGKNKPKILDIGCGWGDFEEVLEKEKIPYLGIDINKKAIEICMKKKLNCLQIDISKLSKKDGWQKWKGSQQRADLAIFAATSSTGGRETPDRIHRNITFDAITHFQVIEHLKNPLPTLLGAKKLLKPGGIILITTPNNESPLRKILGSKWSVYNEPSHFIFFNKETLNKTLQQAGFKNIQTNVDKMRFLSLNYILQRFFEMYLHWKLEIGNWKFSFPIPTDPFGDLEAIVRS